MKIGKLLYCSSLSAVLFLILSCQNTAGNDKSADEKISPNEFTNIPISEDKPLQPSDINLEKLGFDTSSEIPQGLVSGTKAPVFRGIDQKGQTVSLKEKLTKGSVVLIFYRGQWCGVCNRYLSALADSLDIIQQNGTSVIAVAPEIAENAHKTAEKSGLKISIISDSDLSIMNAYGVTFKVNQTYQDKIINYAGNGIAEMNGSEEAFLPVPATYIINPSGIISYAHFDHNYRNRPYIKDLLISL